MNKILVKLYVPMMEEQYDVWIPINKKTYKVIKLLIKAVSEFRGASYKTKDIPLLYDRITAKAYDINLSIKDNNIRNGTEIILI